MPLTKIQSLGITDGTIVNADINASAAIAGTKLSGAGIVLQVVSTDYTSTASSTSATPADVSGFSATITPASASNNILIFVSVCLQSVHNYSGFFIRVILLKFHDIEEIDTCLI